MKSVFSWLSLYLVGIVLFAMAGLYALFAVVNPQVLKSALADNNTYQKIVPAALEEAQKNHSPNDGSQIPLGDPGAKAAIEKAFPASDLQRNSETVIDAIFTWLSGKTSQPEFRLDLTHNKQVLATELGSYAAKRAATLPPCSLKDLQAAKSQDVFTITCLPPGVTPAKVGQEASAQIASNENFLKDPIISSDSLKVEDNNLNNKQADAKPLQKFYQKRSLLSWLLPALVILLAATGIQLASDRLRAVKRLAQIFLMSAVALGIIALLLTVGSSNSQTTTSDDLSTNLAWPIVGDLLHQAAMVYIWFAVISLALSIGLFGIKKRLNVPKVSAANKH